VTIRNDASRLRIPVREKRRSRSVVSRQGQVLLDTDLDQQGSHLLDRIELETIDTIGEPGRLTAPAGGSGFALTPGGAPADFEIIEGRGYLGGWLLENATKCKLTTQPHPRLLPAVDAVGDLAIIGIKSLIRHIDPIEETALADPALGDAQGAGRALADWQVFPLAPASNALADCEAALKDVAWTRLVAPSTGTIAVNLVSSGANTAPCTLTPSGGFSRLENLLYRVEVHGGTTAAVGPTADGPRYGVSGLQLKFSRRNASLMVRITKASGAELTVSPSALDMRNWFAPGSHAEIVSPHDDVDPRAASQAQRMFAVAQATDDRITLAADPGIDPATTELYLRLWDAFPQNVGGVATVGAPGANGAAPGIDLGDGLSLVVGGPAGAQFRRGDYWTFAARADGTIDWPSIANLGTPMTPHGPETRYTVLGIIRNNIISDCRIPFAALTERTLHYRGGDGQSLFPGGGGFKPLPGKLRVAVMRGKTPVAGAKLRWTVPAGAQPSRIGGNLVGNGIETQTNADGLSEVIWEIDAGAPDALHQVQVALLDAGKPAVPALMFTATFNQAKNVGYDNSKACATLKPFDNVQAALDALCTAQTSVAKLPTIIDANWENDRVLDKASLAKKGLTVTFSEDMDKFCFTATGGFIVEMELGQPTGNYKIDGGGSVITRLIVPGHIFGSGSRNLTFIPTFVDGDVPMNLDTATHNSYVVSPFDMKVIRLRVTIRGNAYYAEKKAADDRFRYLNGNVLLAPGNPASGLNFAREKKEILTADSLGPHNFESWFYLADK